MRSRHDCTVQVRRRKTYVECSCGRPQAVRAWFGACHFEGVLNICIIFTLTLPKPMTARVFPTMETPTYLVRSHLPAFTDASAWATFLLSAQISAIPCSAAATVLAVGAFTTRHPCCTETKNLSYSCLRPYVMGQRPFDQAGHCWISICF